MAKSLASFIVGLGSSLCTHHQVDIKICDVPAPAVRGVLASYRDSPDVDSPVEVPGASRDSELVYIWTGLLVPAHTVLRGLFSSEAVVVDAVQGYRNLLGHAVLWMVPWFEREGREN